VNSGIENRSVSLVTHIASLVNDNKQEKYQHQNMRSMCDVHDIPYNFLFTPNVNIDGFFNVTNTNVCPQPKYMVFVSCSSNTTGVTSGAGAACSAGSPEFPSGFYWGSCCSVFSILCSFL
jgi:hypothetical protein